MSHMPTKNGNVLKRLATHDVQHEPWKAWEAQTKSFPHFFERGTGRQEYQHVAAREELTLRVVEGLPRKTSLLNKLACPPNYEPRDWPGLGPHRQKYLHLHPAGNLY